MQSGASPETWMELSLALYIDTAWGLWDTVQIPSRALMHPLDTAECFEFLCNLQTLAMFLNILHMLLRTQMHSANTYEDKLVMHIVWAIVPIPLPQFEGYFHAPPGSVRALFHPLDNAECSVRYILRPSHAVDIAPLKMPYLTLIQIYRVDSCRRPTDLVTAQLTIASVDIAALEHTVQSASGISSRLLSVSAT